MPNNKGKSAMHMKKKRNTTKKNAKILKIHMYGIFDTKKETVVKISMDRLEIDMDIALMGGLGDSLTQCEFDIALVI
jgi:hypothetical protein